MNSEPLPDAYTDRRCPATHLAGRGPNAHRCVKGAAHRGRGSAHRDNLGNDWYDVSDTITGRLKSMITSLRTCQDEPGCADAANAYGYAADELESLLGEWDVDV